MDVIEASIIDEGVIDTVVGKLVKAVKPLKIILFGSWVYGNPRKGSDLDILVVVDDNTKSRYETTVKCYSALRGILIPKDVVVATPELIKDWRGVPDAFITSIIKKGRIVYEKKG
jgi:predicted nucleotidyltransferase